MNNIQKRTSIRKFQDRPIEEEKLLRVLKAGMLAPSACNLMPWEFLVVTDKKDSEAVARMSPYAAPAANAAANIILLVNKTRLEKTDEWWQQDMEEIIPFAVIAAGYPETEAAAKDKYDPERIHMGRY